MTTPRPAAPSSLVTRRVVILLAIVLTELNLPTAVTGFGIAHLFDGTERNWYFLAHRAAHRVIATWNAWTENDGFKRNQHKAVTLAEREAWEEAVDPDPPASLRLTVRAASLAPTWVPATGAVLGVSLRATTSGVTAAHIRDTTTPVARGNLTTINCADQPS